MLYMLSYYGYAPGPHWGTCDPQIPYTGPLQLGQFTYALADFCKLCVKNAE